MAIIEVVFSLCPGLCTLKNWPSLPAHPFLPRCWRWRLHRRPATISASAAGRRPPLVTSVGDAGCDARLLLTSFALALLALPAFTALLALGGGVCLHNVGVCLTGCGGTAAEADSALAAAAALVSVRFEHWALKWKANLPTSPFARNPWGT